MGCDSYRANDTTIKFNEVDDECRCLCTFPHNDGETLDPERLRSLALLGAAVVLSQYGESEFDGWCCIPDSLPKWIDEEIRRILGIEANNNADRG